MSKRLNDFYNKENANINKQAIENYLIQLEQERLQELEKQKDIADKIRKSSTDLQNESK